jgi:hypothetical protein
VNNKEQLQCECGKIVIHTFSQDNVANHQINPGGGVAPLPES